MIETSKKKRDKAKPQLNKQQQQKKYEIKQQYLGIHFTVIKKNAYLKLLLNKKDKKANIYSIFYIIHTITHTLHYLEEETEKTEEIVCLKETKRENSFVRVNLNQMIENWMMQTHVASEGFRLVNIYLRAREKNEKKRDGEKESRKQTQ